MMTTFVKIILSTTLLVTVVQFSIAQNSYDVILEDLVVITYSKEYLLEPEFYIDDSNGLFGNMTIIKKFPEDTQIKFIMKAASMGEYVINMGFDYMAHFCDAFKEPILLGPFYKAIGFDLDNCPPDVGVYVCEDYHTPLDQLPQVFVPNNYNDIVELFCEEQKILTLHIFVKIV